MAKMPSKGKMTPKGMHDIGKGHMMPDAAMAKMMGKQAAKKKGK